MADDNNEIQWNKLDDMVIGMAKTVHYSQPMYGAFDIADDDVQPEASQRQPRQNRPRAEIGEEKRPQQMTEQAVGGADKGAQKLKRIMEQLTEVRNAQACT